MPKISFNTPFYFLTCVTHDRLPVFQTEAMKHLLCATLNEARTSAGFLIFAYVIMADHLHVITDGKRSPSDTLRYINGISARRIIDHLKTAGHERSQRKLQQADKKGGHKYSLWHHHSDKFVITSESMPMQKVNYIHLNPVRGKLVYLPAEYKFSSARQWMGRALEDEPLLTDHKVITWWSK